MAREKEINQRDIEKFKEIAKQKNSKSRKNKSLEFLLKIKKPIEELLEQNIEIKAIQQSLEPSFGKTVSITTLRKFIKEHIKRDDAQTQQETPMVELPTIDLDGFK